MFSFPCMIDRWLWALFSLQSTINQSHSGKLDIQHDLSSLINVLGSQDSHLSKLISETTLGNAVFSVTAQLPALAACLPLDWSVSLQDFSISTQIAPKHIEAMPTYVIYSFQSSLRVQEEDKEATFIRLFSQLKSFNSFKRKRMNLTNSL